MAKRKYRMTEARKQAIAGYRKQYRRITSQVRRLRVKGFEVPSEIIPLKTTSAEFKGLSTAQIKKKTAEAEYLKDYRIEHKAYKVTEVKDYIFTETYEEYKERQKSPLKQKEYNEAINFAVEKTRNERLQNLVDKISAEKEAWDKEREERDRKAREKANSDSQYKYAFTLASIQLQNFENNLASVDKYSSKGYEGLKQTYDSLLAKYGKEAIINNIANSGEDVVGLMAPALNYVSGSEQHESAMRAIKEAMTGHALSAEEEKQLSDIAEQSAYTDDYSI